MHGFIKAALVAVSLACGVALAQSTAIEMEGQKFESTVQLGGQSLQLNGVGLRKRVVFKVYVAGLYVAQKTPNATAVINEKGPRRVELRMLRDLDADTFIGALNEGLKDNLSAAEFASFAPQIASLSASLKSVGEAKKNDVIDFDYTPDAGTRVTVNHVAIGLPIAGADFFNAVLRIWIGEKPADSSLKKEMMGG